MRFLSAAIAAIHQRQVALPMSYSHSEYQPVLSVAPRWAVRVLAWIAFAICAYLAWKAVIGDGPSSACVGGGSDCHDVQTSRWSVWLGMPVAVAGLACYASLAGLSVMTGLTGPRSTRWISTLLVMLSLTAALCGIWFSAIQLFVLGKFCLECMALHVCGLAIAGIVLWGLASRRPSATAVRAVVTPGASAVRPTAAAIPGVVMPRTLRAAPAVSHSSAGPPWAIGAGGAIALLALLIGGQVLFPADTSYQAQVALSQPIELGAVDKVEGAPPSGSQTTGPVPYQANRIPTEGAAADAGVVQTSALVANDSATTPSLTKQDVPNESPRDNEPSIGAVAATPPPESAPRRQRFVKFLSGTVTLDIYQHPVIGNPEAPHVVLEFASYDCHHCHQMHRVVQKAMSRYGDQVAVVILPYPQEMECNKEVKNARNSITGACATARMALGVASLEPAKFEEFHDWLMAGKDKPPTPTQAVQQAYHTVGRDRMRQIPREQLQKQIAQYVDLYIKIKGTTPDPTKVGLPLMVIGNHIISGSQESDQKVFSAWEQHLGVKPVKSATGVEIPTEIKAEPRI